MMLVGQRKSVVTPTEVQLFSWLTVSAQLPERPEGEEGSL